MTGHGKQSETLPAWKMAMSKGIAAFVDMRSTGI